ncbi:hypothetical protein ACJMK2_028661 [Sinanodonta woodiana]|uniref:Cathepsin L n=1 Tax=Sinanodonta woodiana TaxID=1069815 RepID=A0ABD3X999_SINWO
MELNPIMICASILTFVVAAYLVETASGDLNYVHWLEIESVNEIQRNTFGESWELFKITHNKHYESTEEEAYRRNIFYENMKQIYIHNDKYRKGEKSYWLGVNQFSDMTAEEFKALNSGFMPTRVNVTDNTCSTFLPPDNVMLPYTVDWRQKGYVTPVKNQAQCGSCWAFSATGSLEGQNFHKTGKLVSLSEQQLVDCSSAFGNKGCCGGWMVQAFKYIKKYGIETEKEYPYIAKSQECKYKRTKVVAKNTGCVEIAKGNESALQEAVATIGPISVAIDSSHCSFKHYSGGVYEEDQCNSTVVNHAVLVVGYGTEKGKDYWLVKNSWSERWGDKGYIKMARNKGNMCGIASYASYPLV